MEISNPYWVCYNIEIHINNYARNDWQNFQSLFLLTSSLSAPIDRQRVSMGKGNTIVELCSVEIAFKVWKWENIYYLESSHPEEFTCKYLSCKAEVDSSNTRAASFRWREAFCSPSAATTLARASLAASASAAMALCNCTGTLTSCK